MSARIFPLAPIIAAPRANSTPRRAMSTAVNPRPRYPKSSTGVRATAKNAIRMAEGMTT